MSLGDRQTLIKLAVWDVNYFISIQNYVTAAADVNLIYTIYNKPVRFRGSLPFTLPTLSADQADLLANEQLPMELIGDLASAKTALGLTARP